MQEKHCTACGAPFGCGRDDATCWCVELPALPAAALDATRDCLCPRCLAASVADIEHASDAAAPDRPRR